MGFNEFLDIIESHSVSLVITAIVLSMLIPLSRLFVRYVEKKIISDEHDKHYELLDTRNTVNKQINEMLDSAVFSLGLSRAGIIEYHNGGQNAGGLPFLKMSCTYERCNNGVKSFDILKDIHLSLYSDLINKMESNEYYVLDTSDKEEGLSSVIYDVIALQGMGKSLMVKITNPTGRVIGHTVFDYNLENNSFNQGHIEYLKKLSIELGVLLTVK